jgi:hypothetical protein
VATIDSFDGKTLSLHNPCFVHKRIASAKASSSISPASYIVPSISKAKNIFSFIRCSDP